MLGAGDFASNCIKISILLIKQGFLNKDTRKAKIGEKIQSTSFVGLSTGEHLRFSERIRFYYSTKPLVLVGDALVGASYISYTGIKTKNPAISEKNIVDPNLKSLEFLGRTGFKIQRSFLGNKGELFNIVLRNRLGLGRGQNLENSLDIYESELRAFERLYIQKMQVLHLEYSRLNEFP